MSSPFVGFSCGPRSPYRTGSLWQRVFRDRSPGIAWEYSLWEIEVLIRGYSLFNRSCWKLCRTCLVLRSVSPWEWWSGGSASVFDFCVWGSSPKWSAYMWILKSHNSLSYDELYYCAYFELEPMFSWTCWNHIGVKGTAGFEPLSLVLVFYSNPLHHRRFIPAVENMQYISGVFKVN